MSVKKLYFLPAGECFLDKSAVNRNLEPELLVGVPVWSFLLKTTEGPMLIDTGMPDAFINNPERAEYDAAIGNDEYVPLECRLPDLQYQIIEGDHNLIPGDYRFFCNFLLASNHREITASSGSDLAFPVK